MGWNYFSFMDCPVSSLLKEAIKETTRDHSLVFREFKKLNIMNILKTIKFNIPSSYQNESGTVIWYRYIKKFQSAS